MLIKYGGFATVRTVGELKWHKGNDHTLDIADPDQILNFLTISGFSIAPTDPLAQMVGAANAEKLVLVDIFSPDDLTALGKTGLKKAAADSGIPIKDLEKFCAPGARSGEEA